MYTVSENFLTAVTSVSQEHKLTGTIGNISFTGANIVSGSFSIQNQCSDGSGNDIQPGSVIIGELSAVFTGINLTRGQWRNKVITPTFSLKVGNSWEAVPLGVFKVKEAKHTADGVQVKAYDNMHKFDKSFKKKRFKYSGTMYQFLSDICTRCHVTLGMTQAQIQTLPNGSGSRSIYGLYKNQAANDIKTFRDFLSYIAQATCTFATIDRSGKLVLRSFGGSGAVDTISDSVRLSGAVFEDYETKYNGIFVNDMDTGEEIYYGYDADDCADMLTNLNAELTDNTTAHTNLENEKTAGKISESDYNTQKAALDAEANKIQSRITKVNQWDDYREDHPEVAEGASIILGDNPLLQDADIDERDGDRLEILDAAMNINYTPFTCSLVCGAHYDLGDVIEFTNGHAGTSTMCCVMGWEYNLNFENGIEGYGADPDIANVHTLARKKASVALKDFNDTKVEVNSYYDGTNGLELGTISVNGDPKSLYQYRDMAHLEKMDDGSLIVRDENLANGPDGAVCTRSFCMWSENNTQWENNWTTYRVEIKSDHNFLIADCPDIYTTIANIGGKTYYGAQVWLIFKTAYGAPAPKIWQRNTRISSYYPQEDRWKNTRFDGRNDVDWGEWGEAYTVTSHSMRKGDYIYYRRSHTFGATYSGLYGMSRPDKHYPSTDALGAAYAAEELSPLPLKNGDVVLPSATTQQQTIDNLVGLANEITGENNSGSDTSTENQDSIPTSGTATNVASNSKQEIIANTINTIKNGISSWIGNIVNSGRGNVVATVTKRDGTTATQILASTNLITSGSEPPLTGAAQNDLHCVLADESGIVMSQQSSDGDYDFSISRYGYKDTITSKHNASGDPLSFQQFIIKITGLTSGTSYTVSYKLSAATYDASANEYSNVTYTQATIEGVTKRYGRYGVMFTDTTSPDMTGVPTFGSDNTWDSALKWQNFPDLQRPATSFSNTFTATASTMYMVFRLEPITTHDYPLCEKFWVEELKESNMSISFNALKVYGEDDTWYEFAGGGQGTMDYDNLDNKPSINSVTLSGNKTTRDLQIFEKKHLSEFEQLSTAQKNNPDKFYFVDDAGGSGGGGGGGTTVIANPSGEATDELTKLQVGETIYEVVGGGGGGTYYGTTAPSNNIGINGNIYTESSLFEARVYTKADNNWLMYGTADKPSTLYDTSNATAIYDTANSFGNSGVKTKDALENDYTEYMTSWDDSHAAYYNAENKIGAYGGYELSNAIHLSKVKLWIGRYSGQNKTLIITLQIKTEQNGEWIDVANMDVSATIPYPENIFEVIVKQDVYAVRWIHKNEPKKSSNNNIIFFGMKLYVVT